MAKTFPLSRPRVGLVLWDDFRVGDDLLAVLDENFKSYLKSGFYMKRSNRHFWKELLFFMSPISRSNAILRHGVAGSIGDDRNEEDLEHLVVDDQNMGYVLDTGLLDQLL